MIIIAALNDCVINYLFSNEIKPVSVLSPSLLWSVSRKERLVSFKGRNPSVAEGVLAK